MKVTDKQMDPQHLPHFLWFQKEVILGGSSDPWVI